MCSRCYCVCGVPRLALILVVLAVAAGTAAGQSSALDFTGRTGGSCNYAYDTTVDFSGADHATITAFVRNNGSPMDGYVASAFTGGVARLSIRAVNNVLHCVGNGNSYNTGLTIPSGRWVYVACVMTGGNTVTGYVEADSANGGVPSASLPATVVFMIGDSVGGDTDCDGLTDDDRGRQLIGAVDEVRVFDRALNAAELSDLGKFLLTGQEDGLLHAYPLDEGAAGSTTDTGPANQPLTVRNSGRISFIQGVDLPERPGISEPGNELWRKIFTTANVPFFVVGGLLLVAACGGVGVLMRRREEEKERMGHGRSGGKKKRGKARETWYETVYTDPGAGTEVTVAHHRHGTTEVMVNDSVGFGGSGIKMVDDAPATQTKSAVLSTYPSERQRSRTQRSASAGGGSSSGGGVRRAGSSGQRSAGSGRSKHRHRKPTVGSSGGRSASSARGGRSAGSRGRTASNVAGSMKQPKTTYDPGFYDTNTSLSATKLVSNPAAERARAASAQQPVSEAVAGSRRPGISSAKQPTTSSGVNSSAGSAGTSVGDFGGLGPSSAPAADDEYWTMNPDVNSNIALIAPSVKVLKSPAEKKSAGSRSAGSSSGGRRRHRRRDMDRDRDKDKEKAKEKERKAEDKAKEMARKAEEKKEKRRLVEAMDAAATMETKASSTGDESDDDERFLPGPEYSSGLPW